ncbi:hypothetical protein KUH32_10705 [Thalassococcus sp. CAU 1522]|uniref:Lipoprotein n=1 Tax=Thalassococcus arenae TaxID=2851652 RepID=A0ABS6N8B9_9RHOB|nr:hypothetical protein [Thalassococcus arenae]MBV2360246.1 hypothetical protein [Thalassococcus arenae]
MRRTALALACAALGAGCAEQDLLQFQGRPAQTVDECRAAYEAARQRGANTPVNYSSGASVLGAGIGKSMARGMIDSAYRSCLARVANNPGAPVQTPATGRQPARVTTLSRPAVTAPSVGCTRGGGVMQGGTGYCVGY